MATTSYTIYSHYDPKDRERLERETGQIPESSEDVKEVEADPDEAWRTEASLAYRKKPAPPPAFVPASIPFDDWGSVKSISSKPVHDQSSLGNGLAGWYRSLSRSSKDIERSPEKVEPVTRSTQSAAPEVARIVPARPERTTKNNWFIQKAIQSEPSSTSSTPAPSLAEMLARDPPPLPTEEKFEPPVWLEIGPSNRGFAMLQRSGWNEGEPLGPDVVRRRKIQDIIDPDGDIIPTLNKEERRSGTSSRSVVRREIHEIKLEDDEVSELRNVNVIDLTLSDSDGDDEEDINTAVSEFDDDQSPPPQDGSGGGYLPGEDEDSGSHGRKALLTPIATVLKSDRLGIGLKAKTTGPYKASQKRVTHNAAALAAHIRAGNEIRKQKKEMGRGRRGFERQRKKEEANRQMMLAYMNS